MGLTNKKEEQLKKMPRIESHIFKTRDNKWLVQKTTISTVRPVQYYQKILDSAHAPTLEDFDDSDFFIQEGEELVS